MEDAKLLPFSAVWDYYCHKTNVPVAEAWLAEIKNYERTVLMNRK
jgi:L-rhamnose isomerase